MGVFEVEQELFAPEAAAITAQMSVLIYNTVTREQECDSIHAVASWAQEGAVLKVR